MNILQKYDHRQSFTKEEQNEIFDSSHAEAIAGGIINDPKYRNVESMETKDWYERAGFCLSQINLRFHWQFLQYGLYSLDRFIVLSQGSNDPQAKTAANLMGDIGDEWRTWKELSKAASISMDMNATSRIYLKKGTILFKLGYFDKAIILFDRIINMPIRGGECVEEATVMKNSCLMKMGES